MKRAQLVALVIVSALLSHVLAPAVAWAQAKAQNAFYSLTVTDTVTASGDVAADQYVASGAASQYSCSKTDGTCQFSSSTADATTSSTVGAITLKAGANITAADLLLDVQDSAGAHAFTCTEAGTCVALLGMNVPQNGVLGVTATGTHGFYYDATNMHWRMANASYGRVNNGSGKFTWDYVVNAADFEGDASVRGSCNLSSGTPSTCTATVTAGAICQCSPVGTTAAIAAAGCAVSLSGTTLTITGPNSVTTTMNYLCFL